MLLHKAAKTRKVGGDTGNSHHRALSWGRTEQLSGDTWTDGQTNGQTDRRHKVTRCISPRLVIGGEHSQVTTTNKVFIVHGEQRTCRGQKLRMEDDLDVKEVG